MKNILFIGLILLISFSAISQEENFNFPVVPIEHIIVNTDRNFYLNQEKIWFNAYCYNSEKEIFHDLSNVLYIELFNSSREFLVKRKFNIVNGYANGAIDIPSEFLSGNYYLRAYTQYLKNFSPDSYFTSLVTIINPNFKLPEKKEINAKNNIEILTQGGELINGVKTQIAYQISDELNYQPKTIRIVDDQDNIIASPLFSENGLGICEITPDSSSNYSIQLLLNNNDSIIKSIPSITNGIILKTTFSSNNRLLVDIINANNISETSTKDYELVILSQYLKVLVTTNITLTNKITQFIFPKDILDEGIHYLVLKQSQNNNIKIHAFYNKKEAIKVNVNTQKKTYLPRELIKLDIASLNLNPKAIMNLSVSVVKKGTLNNTATLQKNILGNPQLLSSYLQDFNNVQSLSKEQIDILMIYYNKMLSNNAYNYLFEKYKNDIQWVADIRDVSVSGVVYSKDNNLPIPNIPVYISAFKENPQIHIYKTNKNGEFIFSLNNLVDQQDIYLSTKPRAGTEVELRINNDFLAEFPQTTNIPLSINKSHTLFLEEMFIISQATNVFNTKVSNIQTPKAPLPYTFKNPQETIFINDYINTATLERFFNEIVPNVNVQKNKDQFNLVVCDYEQSKFYDSPLILVDYIPIFDVNEIMKISPANIEKIELYKQPFILSNNIINGIIMFTTRSDNFGGVKMPQASAFLKYQTISPSFKFDYPMYDTEEKRGNRSADFRNLLYWNPHLSISNNASLSFYASDNYSEYDVIVKGYTNEGRECFGKTSFKVVSNK